MPRDRVGRRPTVILLCLSLVAGCAGGEAASSSPDAGQDAAPPPPREQPTAAPEQLRELRRLMVDVGARELCDHLSGRMMTMGSDGHGPDTGRIWLNDCEARRDGDQLEIEFGAWAWTFVDRTADAAGATFAVRGYVVLAASTTMRVSPQIEYRRDAGELILWMRPERPPRVTTRLVGRVQARSQDAWSHVVGGVATLFGSDPDDQARQRVTETGAARFEEQLREGFTVYSDLCTGVTGMEMGRLREMPEPRRAPSEAGPPTRMRLHATGIDVHGPLTGGGEEIEVHLRTSDAPVRASLMCGADADDFIRRWTRGDLSPGPSVDDARAAPSDPAILRGGGASPCDLFLVTTPERGATTLEFTTRSPDAEAAPRVPGCGGA